MRVLVVDDESGFREMLKWELGDHGIEVETAADGLEAFEKAKRQMFDVIITDVTMPGMNGIEFLEKVKATHSKAEFIVVTGFGAVETAVYAMQKGATDFLLKPYDLKNLMKAVESAAQQTRRCQTCGGSDEA